MPWLIASSLRTFSPSRYIMIDVSASPACMSASDRCTHPRFAPCLHPVSFCRPQQDPAVRFGCAPARSSPTRSFPPCALTSTVRPIPFALIEATRSPSTWIRVAAPIHSVPGNPACSCEQLTASGGPSRPPVLCAELLRDGTRDPRIRGHWQVRPVLFVRPDRNGCEARAHFATSALVASVSTCTSWVILLPPCNFAPPRALPRVRFGLPPGTPRPLLLRGPPLPPVPSSPGPFRPARRPPAISRSFSHAVRISARSSGNGPSRFRGEVHLRPLSSSASRASSAGDHLPEHPDGPFFPARLRGGYCEVPAPAETLPALFPPGLRLRPRPLHVSCAHQRGQGVAREPVRVRVVLHLVPVPGRVVLQRVPVAPRRHGAEDQHRGGCRTGSDPCRGAAPDLPDSSPRAAAPPPMSLPAMRTPPVTRG